MRFTVRPGTDPTAVADRILLRAMGLPAGGAVAVGNTHVTVQPGPTPQPTAILLGPETIANAGVGEGTSVDVRRTVLPAATAVSFAADTGLDARTLVHALQGRPLTRGDRVTIASEYLDGGAAITLEVADVEPDGAGLVGPPTRFAGAEPVAEPSGGRGPGAAPSTSTAMLAGLDNELDMLTGWFSLLASRDDLAAAWGIPHVAGILLEGPNGCGKSDLVAEAARRAGTPVDEVDVGLVFKPERLLDVLAAAVKQAPGPRVILVDRLETLTGDSALSTFRTQFAAILRWFLDAVAEAPRIACVLGVASIDALDESITRSPLLPRSLEVPPPDLERRRLLFEATLDRVPTAEVDHEQLAARSAGFSGSDIMAAVVGAASVVARTGEPLTTDDLIHAVESITPSLGSVPLGEVSSIGFDQVANLDDVKQRLTEAVIWPTLEPERFERLGIDPPTGILLYGPPGTGKTFVVKALAHEAGAAVFSVKGAELLDKYVGESERGVREVFARARAAAPAIIFFDEFDALAPVRGRSSSTVSDSVVAALLTELDGMADRGQVAVVAATNRRDLIDPALLRAGRFEVHIELGLPGTAARRALLALSDVPLADEVDVAQLAERTDGLSFADLTGLLREAALAALRNDEAAIAITWAHIDPALASYHDRPR